MHSFQMKFEYFINISGYTSNAIKQSDVKAESAKMFTALCSA